MAPSMTLLRMTCLVLALISISVASLSKSFPTIPKNLNESADLSCDKPCSGVTLWKMGNAEVASCGPGAKPGLRFNCTVVDGKSTLTVPRVNHSTRGHYSAYCDRGEMFDCRQILQLLTPMSALELNRGHDLKLDLHVSGSVKIDYTRPGSLSTVPVCRVTGRLSHCLPEYEERALSCGNTFILRNLGPSDSGSYAVVEEDDTAVSVLNLTVKDVRQTETPTDGFGTEAVIFGMAMLFVGLLLGVFVVPKVCYQIHRVDQRCRGSSHSENAQTVESTAVPLKESHINMEPEG